MNSQIKYHDILDQFPNIVIATIMLSTVGLVLMRFWINIIISIVDRMTEWVKAKY